MERFAKKVRIRNTLVRETLAEFLGTFTLIVFGDGSVAQAVLSKNAVGNHASIHWAWGIAVTMGVFVSGGISGGHLNPAVTVALACVKKTPWKKVPCFILAQYLGAFCASAMIFFVYYEALNNYDGGTRQVTGPLATAGIWATYPQEFASTATCFGDQLLGTGMLLLCVMAITDERNMETPKGLIPFVIGLIVTVIGMTYHWNCGYAINPARDLGPRIFTAVAGWGVDVFSYRGYNYFWIPVVGPHVGAIIGVFLYQFVVGFHWIPSYEVAEVTNELTLNDLNGTATRDKRSRDKGVLAFDNKSMSPDAEETMNYGF